MDKKKVCCWDLEGPISVLDFAAEIGRMLQNKEELKLRDYDMGEFFFMISQYDDYLIDIPGVKEELGIPEYQPGDTLRLMAPMYVACFSDIELINLAKANFGILPGIRELMAILEKDWELFVISTSYTQFAYQVTKELKIPQDHVYCTELPIEDLKSDVSNIDQSVDYLVKTIFHQYLEHDKNLEKVIDDLNAFFWSDQHSDYLKIMNQVKVRGGERKELAVEKISQRTETPISSMIAIGDSITDINMLERLNIEGGIAVSFNGNRFSLKNANIALTTPNGLGILPLFENYDDIWNFIEKWNNDFNNFKSNPKKIPDNLISKVCKNHLIYYDFVPDIKSLKNRSTKALNSIIEEQEKMRKLVRGWAGNLG
ncbi:MAG: HAD hydrolase family protein [Candidatus Lokiarchaeota archaeon]|nr:HAD hydrolase family protein [Candidatus Lokiarchaeota archaeon]MBD3202022.1 HAD hydrolase family protein [Candidatus Lokiarchaeota archaeon]